MAQSLLSALMPSRAAKLAGCGSFFEVGLLEGLAIMSAKGTKHASIQAKKASSVSRDRSEATFSKDEELFTPTNEALVISKS